MWYVVYSVYAVACIVSPAREVLIIAGTSNIDVHCTLCAAMNFVFLGHPQQRNLTEAVIICF